MTHHVVHLDETERTVLLAATDKRPLENVLRRWRYALNSELSTIADLAASNAPITAEKVQAARAVLNRRLDLLLHTPDTIVDSELIQAAAQPMQHALAECDRILRELATSGQQAGTALPGGPTTATTTSELLG